MKQYWFVFALLFSVCLHAIENIPSLYQVHLPADLYLVAQKAQLVDEGREETTLERQTAEGKDLLRISRLSRGGSPCVFIDYEPAQIEGNFGGVQLVYQKGRLIDYALFDTTGRDFVAVTAPPFSQEEEKIMASLVLDKVFPLFEMR